MAENANAHPVSLVRRRRRCNEVHVAPMSACLFGKGNFDLAWRAEFVSVGRDPLVATCMRY